jgi:hypothetical protein
LAPDPSLLPALTLPAYVQGPAFLELAEAAGGGYAAEGGGGVAGLGRPAQLLAVALVDLPGDRGAAEGLVRSLVATIRAASSLIRSDASGGTSSSCGVVGIRVRDVISSTASGFCFESSGASRVQDHL